MSSFTIRLAMRAESRHESGMRKSPYFQIAGAILVLWDRALSPLLGSFGNVDEVCSLTGLPSERCGSHSMIQAVFAGSWTEPLLTLAGIALILYGERKRTSEIIGKAVDSEIKQLRNELKKRQSLSEDSVAHALAEIEKIESNTNEALHGDKAMRTMKDAEMLAIVSSSREHIEALSKISSSLSVKVEALSLQSPPSTAPETQP